VKRACGHARSGYERVKQAALKAERVRVCMHAHTHTHRLLADSRHLRTHVCPEVLSPLGPVRTTDGTVGVPLRAVLQAVQDAAPLRDL